MADASDVLVSLQGVSKDYRSLRPLRVAHLELRRGQILALLGVDQAAAEVLVNLITAATLPDAGEVRILDRPTTDVTDSDTWIGLLEHFGILSARAVLVERLSVRQNLTMPHTLEVDEPPLEVREKVASLAEELGLDHGMLVQSVGESSRAVRARVQLGRALALGPTVLLAEHPGSLVEAHEAMALAADLARVISRRNVACLLLTADVQFAHAVTRDVFALEHATGRLKPVGRWRRWLG
jgi:ABC-type lipoprotein export system ATPase subunit